MFGLKLDKSREASALSPLNILDTSVALLPVHWLKSPTLFKDLQLKNILIKDVDPLGLKLVKSREVSASSPSNILETFFALLPVHWLKSPTLVKALQPANIYEKLVAGLGLNLAKSSFFKLLSSLNILDTSVAELPFQESMPLIVVKLEQPLNRPLKSLT